MTPVQPIPGIGLQEDARARDLIRTALGETLVVEAAAGTGKTTELVKRIIAVLRAGHARVDQIVAVTFTHKAAGELKVRLRQELDEARQSAAGDENARLEDAIQHLEEASIGTIHSFCTQLLRERPVEAGVDPQFQDLAEGEQRRLYRRVFRTWFERALNESRPGLRRVLTRLAWTGDGNPADEVEIAGWKLIEWRDFRTPWRRPDFERDSEIAHLVDHVRTLAEAVECCERRSDELYRHLAPAREFVTWLDRAGPRIEPDTLEALLLKLLKDLNRNPRKGRGQFGGGITREEVLRAREAVLQELRAFQVRADADLAALLQSDLQDLIDAYETAKQGAGKLDFMDLLTKARDLLLDHREVRRFFQTRYTRIFIDEFQDTDPLQVEILLLLAAGDAESDDWRQTTAMPGKLFLVGDPKQSIYRFRRADAALYQEIRDHLLRGGARLVRLSKSFRAPAPIQECINAAFFPEMREDPETAQAAYVPLLGGGDGIPGQPAVVVLPAPVSWTGREVYKKSVDACLPDAVCAFVEWLLGSGWKVRDLQDPSRLVPIQPRHIAVLFKRVLNNREDMARPYVRGLEAREIPHLLVASKSFHHREEVECLRAVCTAIEWPDDELSVYATLRGPLFAVPDSLLLRYRFEAGARVHPLRRGADGIAPVFAPISGALDVLAELHRNRNRRAVSATVAALLEGARAHIGFALRPGGHQVLANVNRVIELARSFEQGGGISFRGFVDELAERAESADSSEAPMIEESAEGVRLMTVHTAKGLEFPVVILADLTSNLAQRNPERYVDSVRKVCATRLVMYAPFDWLIPVELSEHMAQENGRECAEGVRVAYVAATRARDLLVVPGVGTEQFDGWLKPLNKAIYPASRNCRESRPAPGCPEFGSSTMIEGPEAEAVRPGLLRAQAGSHDVVWWDPACLRLNVAPRQGLRTLDLLQGDGTAGAEAYEQWRQRRDLSLRQGAVPTWQVWNPSEMGDPPAGELVTVVREIVESREPRPSGPRFGTLVHAVLRETSGPGDPVAGLVRTHGQVLGATAEEMDAARAAVMQALDHPLLVRARQASRTHREMPIVLPLGSQEVMEGVIDLMFLEGRTWHIVDFKTGLDHAAWAQYERQIRWYGHAIAKLTGLPVACHLLAI